MTMTSWKKKNAYTSNTYLGGGGIPVVVVPIFLLLHITGLDGLRDVKLEGPRFVRQGEENVNLQCSYKLENDTIYAVKWYRGTQEFYRFVPKEVPPKQFFLLPGLSFNEDYCNERHISLRNVSLETTGRFKCAVSAEMTFQTLTASSELTVTRVGYGLPVIAAEHTNYYPGESVGINCSLEGVSHFPNFTWYMNGMEVPRWMFTDSLLENDTSLALSVLTFEMGTRQTLDEVNNKQGHFIDGWRVRCHVDVFDLYSETSEEIVIHMTSPPVYAPSSNHHYHNQQQDAQKRDPVSIIGGGSESRSQFPGLWMITVSLLFLRV